MGKESREKEQQETIGKYNVRITLLFMPEDKSYMKEESINCKNWIHAGQFLALTLFNGTLRIVNLNQYHGFSINALDPETLEKLN